LARQLCKPERGGIIGAGEAVMRVRAALIIVLLGIRTAAAQPQWPVLDIQPVPPPLRGVYAAFLLMNVPRAFAMASNGHAGAQNGRSSEDARARALKLCADKGGIDCAIYAEDLQVTWQGRAAIPLPATPAPLIATRDYAFAPDARFFWWGPQAARGVLVWAHGKGNAYNGRGQQPPPTVLAFNNAGFDVIRFERDPSVDYADDAAGWLRKGLATLRARGWRMVIAAGQSRGAWNSLQALDTPGLADAVIAVSPASFASVATQEGDLSRILHNIASPNARVVVAQFKGDVYVRDMQGRLDMLRSLLPSRVAATLVIAEPEGIDGHTGGETALFARRYGRCLLDFVTAPVPPTACVPEVGF
jgi:hypothetical protein